MTWDRPGEPNDQEGDVNQEQVPMSPLEDGGAEDQTTRHDDTQQEDQQEDQQDGNHSTGSGYDKHYRGKSVDSYKSDNDDSAYVAYDDQSSTSSGIAALSRWNNQTDERQLGKSDRTSSEDEDLIAWSDDEGGDKFDAEETRNASASQRKQPWHKTDSNGMGNNDSFIYD